MAKVLIVEDDEDLQLKLGDYLQMERFAVEQVRDGVDALERLRTYEYDVVILDWALPGLSGLDVLKEFRKAGGATPVLMLTGKQEVDEKAEGFGSGADDYLTKPFQLRELCMRLRALLRRPAQLAGDVLCVGDLRVDARSFTVTRNGEEIKLSPREFALLEFLARHKNQTFSAEALLDRVWVAEDDVSLDAVRQCMIRLRRKIDPEGSTPLLHTVFGVGYKLQEP